MSSNPDLGHAHETCGRFKLVLDNTQPCFNECQRKKRKPTNYKNQTESHPI